VLSPAATDLASSQQIRTLYRLNDPALSELGLEDLLGELLVLLRDALSVDTAAILLLDPETDQLVAVPPRESRKRSTRESGSRSAWGLPGASPPSA
jgi:hypothetical protein